MEFTPLTNLFFALIILLLAAAIYIALTIKDLQLQLHRLSYELYFEATRQADLIPQFLVQFGGMVPRTDFGKVIDLRSRNLNCTVMGKEKQELEQAMWLEFNRLLDQAKKNPEYKNNLMLLALEKDLEDAAARLKDKKTVFNKTVEKYNKIVGNFLLKPVSMVIKAKIQESF
jgi:hypothetical protein